MKKGLVFLLLLGHWIAANEALANSGAVRDWLNRMTAAVESLDYQGTFIYLQDGKVESIRITHVVTEAGSKERLYSITGPRLEIIRTNNELKCIYPDDQAVVLDEFLSGPAFPVIPIDELLDPETRYELQLGPIERIAGKSAQRIEITPLDEYRYGYSLWLDHDTGLLLKSVLRDIDSTVIAKLMFTDIRYGDEVDKAELEPEAELSQYVSVTSQVPVGEAAHNSENADWQAAELPPGFRLTSHRHDQVQEGRVFEHLVFTDGLATVSVYVESLPEGQSPMKGLSRVGAMHVYARLRDNLQITVVGEVPELTVRTIAETVTHVQVRD